MTDELIARAKVALEGVTPGPWFMHDYGASHDYAPHCNDVCVSCSDPDELTVCQMEGADIGHVVEAQEPAYRQAVLNAYFIAASRQLVPDLLSEVERLRAERDALLTVRDAAASVAAYYGPCSVQDKVFLSAMGELVAALRALQEDSQ